MGNSALSRNVIVLDQKGKRRQSDVYPRFLSEIDYFWGVTPERMVIKNNVTNPLHQIDVSCGKILIEGSLIDSVGVTVDVTVSGVNGVDIGVEVNNTWYYIWLIYNPTTATVAGLFSTSSTNPTLPTGYTKKRLVGAVRNNVSSNFLRFKQINNMVWYDENYVTTLMVNNFNNTAYSSYDAAVWFPHVIASEILLKVACGDSTGDNAAVVTVRPNGFTLGEIRTNISAQVAGTLAVGQRLPVRMIMLSSVLDYKVSNAAESGDIYMDGFKLKLW